MTGSPDQEDILFITSSMSVGGAQRVISILANSFAKNGYRVRIAATSYDAVTYPMREGVKYTFLACKSKNKIVKYFERSSQIRSIIKKYRFKAMITFQTHYGVLSVSGLGIKKITSLRNDPASDLKQTLSETVLRLLRYISFSLADAVVFQTEGAKNYFGNHIRKKGRVIPNPVSPDLPEPYTGNRSNRIVAVGRLSGQKNFAMLLDAFARFHAKRPEYTLHIYGDGPLKDDLLRHTEALSLNECVTFEGFADDVAVRIRDAAMYVSSSDYEGISNSMLEALALGIPSVCTDCSGGGARQFIRSGQNGLLVPVRDPGRLCEAMLSLAEDPVLAERLSRNAQGIADELSEERIYSMWKKVVDESIS